MLRNCMYFYVSDFLVKNFNNHVFAISNSVDIVTFKTPDEEICMTFFMNMKDFAFTVFLG